jgi:cellulose synthase/poly-beta-1,6-N-acetylglucosamine synthase-like glycosyltransferase
MKRRIAIAVPACNEAGFIGACLAGLAQAAASDKGPPPDLVVLANNCTDETAEIARRHASDGRCRLHIQSVALPPDRSHAGWARRLALDLAASLLTEPDDIILSTDADTVVAENWISRTLNYIEEGYDAVAGLARLNPSELRRLAPPHRRRLAQIRRYGHAIDYLKAQHDLSEPWPRHFYEGGASMALTLGMYRAIGGAPTPTVGEDKALFDAVRRSGGKVRHASDVRVRTSARLHGRAVGGASDTLALWGRQSQDEPAAGLHNIATCLGQTSANEGGLTFKDLPRETQRARFLVEQARRPLAFA